MILQFPWKAGNPTDPNVDAVLAACADLGVDRPAAAKLVRLAAEMKALDDAELAGLEDQPA